MSLTSRLFLFYAGSLLVILINLVFVERAYLSIALTPTIAIIVLASLVTWFNDSASDQIIEIDEKQADSNEHQVVERMANRMNKSLKKHLNTPCTILAIEDTKAAYEIDIIIGDEDLLTAYQEVAIIPYERIRDMDYWQQITKILINNYRIRNNPQSKVVAKQEMVKSPTRRRRRNTSKSNT